MRINDELLIDESEIEIQTTTSRGPGGQHVNRSETRVVLRLNVMTSTSLSTEQRSTILRKLGSRISREGILQVAAEEHRSQLRNRELARERMIELLANALHRDRPRKPTRPTRASQHRRVDDKKRRGTVKQGRKKPADD
jgi:ribosome-associated protein